MREKRKFIQYLNISFPLRAMNRRLFPLHSESFLFQVRIPVFSKTIYHFLFFLSLTHSSDCLLSLCSFINASLRMSCPALKRIIPDMIRWVYICWNLYFLLNLDIFSSTKSDCISFFKKQPHNPVICLILSWQSIKSPGALQTSFCFPFILTCPTDSW